MNPVRAALKRLRDLFLRSVTYQVGLSNTKLSQIEVAIGQLRTITAPLTELNGKLDRLGREIDSLRRTATPPPPAKQDAEPKAQHLLHVIARSTGAKSCLLCTSEGTGIPALRGISIPEFEFLTSIRYSTELRTSKSDTLQKSRFVSLPAALSGARRLAPFDIAFIDPYHDYAESAQVLSELSDQLRESGWIIVHDCYPPYELANEQHQDGAWCGSTYAAFRDFACRSNRAWFVVDTDFGVGIMGPAHTHGCILDLINPALVERWEHSDIAGKRDLLKSDGSALMRVIRPDQFEHFVDGICNHRTMIVNAPGQ